MTVRRIEPDDASVLRRVRLAALEEAPSAFGSTHAAEAVRSDREWAERAVAGSGGVDGATFFADEAGEVVGLVGGYRAEPSDRLVELVSMWVAPRIRRRGVGRALVEAVATWAEEADAAEVALWVTSSNIAAENLHQSRASSRRETDSPSHRIRRKKKQG